MTEVVGVSGDDEVEPFRFRTGDPDVILEIAPRQCASAQQYCLIYWQNLKRKTPINTCQSGRDTYLPPSDIEDV